MFKVPIVFTVYAFAKQTLSFLISNSISHIERQDKYTPNSLQVSNYFGVQLPHRLLCVELYEEEKNIFKIYPTD